MDSLDTGLFVACAGSTLERDRVLTLCERESENEQPHSGRALIYLPRAMEECSKSQWGEPVQLLISNVVEERNFGAGTSLFLCHVQGKETTLIRLWFCALSKQKFTFQMATVYDALHAKSRANDVIPLVRCNARAVTRLTFVVD